MLRAPLVLVSVLVAGCYAHAPGNRDASGASRIRPSLIAPTSGRYTITRDGVVIGEEDFTVTSSGSVWRAKGEVRLRSPVESVHGYTLEIDEDSAEPIAFVAWFEMFGARREARGRRGLDGFFDVRTFGIGGARTKQVPYAPGTILAFDSPLFATLALSLLELEPRAPIPIRTILLPLPDLEPTVLLTTYELFEERGDVRRVVVRRSRTELPVAMWVREDGLPIRVRTFVTKDGPPIERRLEGVTAPSARALPRAPW